MNIRQSSSFCHLQNISDHEIIRCLIRIDLTLRGGVGPFPVLARVEYLAPFFPAKVRSAFHPSEVGKMSTSMHGLL